MRTLIAVALMVISVTAMGAAPKASAPASPQAFFQQEMALALKGDADAQVFVGLSYDFGYTGQAVNKKEAVKWYRLAAEQGHTDAQVNLGNRYHEGEGVTQDYKEAVKWYRLAAEQGSASAQYILGISYERGEGVTQNYKEAAKWYRLSAEQGDAEAQASLSLMYTDGLGVPENIIYAHMWANIGASNGSKRAAKNRDLVAPQMPPSLLEKVQDLARACVKQNYKGC